MSIQVSSTTDPTPADKAAATRAANAAKTEAEAKSAPASTEKPEHNASESDPEKADPKEAKKDVSEDALVDETDEQTDDNEKDDGKPRRKNGFRRRIDKLTSRAADAERERDFWKKEAMEKAGGKDKDVEPKTEPKSQDSKTFSGKEKPKAEDFETNAEFVDAMTDWKIEERDAKAEETATKSKILTEEQQAKKAHVDRVTAFMKTHDDFEEVIEALDDVPTSAALTEAIVTSDNGPALLYELAKNPEEAKRIAKLNPLAAAREIGKIEARLARESAAPEDTKDEEPKTTKAPKPLTPVSGGKGTRAKSLDDPNLTQREYEQIRREQMKKQA